MTMKLDVDYGYLHLPDGKTMRYGVDTLSKLGMNFNGNNRIDEIMFRSYEEVESKIRYLKIKPNDIFIDVGACIGSWAIYAAIYGAKVHAFEIGDVQLQAFSINAIMNGVGKNIVIYKTALVSDNNKKFVFDGGMSINSGGIGTEVESVSMDKWTELYKKELPHIEYIKIDVEGMEYDVLVGGLNTVKEYRPKIIIEIHDDDNRTNIEKLLEELNYGHERVPGLNDYFYPKTNS